MKLVDRLLLAILALVAIIVSGFVIIFSLGLINLNTVIDFLTVNTNSLSFILVSVIVSVIIVLISLRLLLVKKEAAYGEKHLVKKQRTGDN
jgi:biotin transporter BioY